MSSANFSADWLQLREPFDAAARDAAAGDLQLVGRLAPLRKGLTRPLRVIDLACGTGANLRWLAPRLGGAQQWLVVDHDADLLRCWPERLATVAGAQTGAGVDLDQSLSFAGPGFEARIVRQPMDLMAGLETLPWQAADLVTASALLDLVGTDWLHRLVAASAASGVALLMSLSVDGRHVWAPGDPADATVGKQFAEHQRRDKGLGPALGADAVAELRLALESAGYRVFTAASDWWVDGGESLSALSLQCALIDGMAAAAGEQAGTTAQPVEAWRRRRLAMAARSQLRVGHLDLLALPS
ncbi:MAG: SAM-dependent methyltransferase [Polaromonas sp.]|nr:SAM-dependent methyltransferase [Polaromonas sp.]